ncbi:GNAT family N-acetyltransferase [Alkaliphilus peptidifermentans]|uniref:Spore maturation protein CgeE n=1 Tax=Alkaliphilus peptidifermentans DSM 18978 TaxID=1120976 RepID=A0A1G5KR66_9FIRM|nr:GNAT family N-acetyltransferase [Alkaliphilus peptidifermentans]SCZ02429.1 spore maturation protein CgeE [Alkaliphilus peptidifermentans DSM 18978]
MFSRLIDTEIEYIKKFTENHENKDSIKFFDDKLPNMYTHNFTFIKNSVCENDIKRIINEELENRCSGNKDFLRIEFNGTFSEDFIKGLPITPEVSIYDYMWIEPQMGNYLSVNEGCIVKKAISEKVLKDGIEVDILANQSGMGTEFAAKRIFRKAEVYTNPNSGLNFYVCYTSNIPIGNCELMVNNKVAKIEDFDILEEYQRKGYGTTVVKHLLKEAKGNGVEHVYLITDGEDTAKEMYKKCGFRKVGEKTELFFDLINHCKL